MNVQTNIAEKQQKFIIPIDTKTAKTVDTNDRKILVDAYMKLFMGFSWVNWANKFSLGRTWQNALEQCGAFIQTKNKNNPAAKYLNNTLQGHKKYWSKIIMTHKNRDNKSNADDKEMKKLREYGTRLIRQAMDSINLVLARYNEHTEELYAEKMTPQAKQQPMAQAKPVVKPVEKPMAQAQEQPVVKPVEKPMAQAQAQLVAKPVEKPMTQAQTQPVAKPVEKPIAQAQEQPVVKPAEKPMMQAQAKPVVKPVEKPMTQAQQITPAERKERLVAAQQKIEIQITRIQIIAQQQRQQQQLRIIAMNKLNQRAA